MKKERSTAKGKRPLPMLSGMKPKDEIVGTQTWVNQETGEVREVLVINRSQLGDFGFHKVWVEDLGRVIGVLGGSKNKVFAYLLSNINPISNQFGGTIREVAEILNIDTVTVQKTFSILVREQFMRRVRAGTYQVNSGVLVKGTHEKRIGLMVTYGKLEGPDENAIYVKDDI